MPHRCKDLPSRETTILQPEMPGQLALAGAPHARFGESRSCDQNASRTSNHGCPITGGIAAVTRIRTDTGEKTEEDQPHREQLHQDQPLQEQNRWKSASTASQRPFP